MVEGRTVHGELFQGLEMGPWGTSWCWCSPGGTMNWGKGVCAQGGVSCQMRTRQMRQLGTEVGGGGWWNHKPAG